MPGIVDEIRKSLREASEQGEGGSGMPDALLWIPSDGQRQVRFLTEFTSEEIVKVTMHDKFKLFYPQPCLRYYGEPCLFHVKGVRTKTHYHFTVWDYESASKKIFAYKAIPGGAIEDLIEYHDTYDTIKDRDFILKKIGTGPKTRVRARPATPTPTPYEGRLNKPYSEAKIIEILRPLVRVKTLPAGLSAEADEESGESEDE